MLNSWEYSLDYEELSRRREELKAEMARPVGALCMNEILDIHFGDERDGHYAHNRTYYPETEQERAS